MHVSMYQSSRMEWGQICLWQCAIQNHCASVLCWLTSRPWHGDMVRISIISSVRYLDIVPSEQQHLTCHVTALVCSTAFSGARSRQLKGQQSLFKIETVFNIYYVSYCLCRSNKMVAAGSSRVWVCIYCAVFTVIWRCREPPSSSPSRMRTARPRPPSGHTLH